MKVNIKSYIKRVLPLFIVGAALTACEDFLDKQPPSYIVPEDYYRSEDQILASANKFYTDLLPSHGGNYGTFQSDVHTDNQAGRSGDSKYAIGQWKWITVTGRGVLFAISTINWVQYSTGTEKERYRVPIKTSVTTSVSITSSGHSVILQCSECGVICLS